MKCIGTVAVSAANLFVFFNIISSGPMFFVHIDLYIVWMFTSSYVAKNLRCYIRLVAGEGT